MKTERKKKGIIKKSKGFILIDLSIMTVITAILLVIFQPVPEPSTNQILAGVGKANLLYSNDYDDEFPLSGSR